MSLQNSIDGGINGLGSWKMKKVYMTYSKNQLFKLKLKN